MTSDKCKFVCFSDPYIPPVSNKNGKRQAESWVPPRISKRARFQRDPVQGQSQGQSGNSRNQGFDNPNWTMEVWDMFKPCHAEFVLREQEAYLHFPSFLYTEMARLIEICLSGKRGLVYLAWLIWEMWLWFQMCEFQTQSGDWYLEHLTLNTRGPSISV